MKELWKILWVESGWAKLTIEERIKMKYFMLSLFLVLASAESSIWLLGATTLNFALSGKIVRTIKTDIPDE